MNNIIRSDMYRLKKSRVLGVSILVTIGLVVLIWAITAITSTIINIGPMAAQVTETGNLETISNQVSQTTSTAANFIKQIMGENFLIFMFLVIVLAVFGEDYNSGTYKNTLSFESNRAKVYFGKFLLSVGLCFILKIISFLTALLVGVLLIPNKDLSTDFFAQMGIGFLLQIPTYLAIISVLFCLFTFMKKSSVTIGVYLLGIMVMSVPIQLLVMTFPKLDWLSFLDPSQAPLALINYPKLNTSELILGICLPLAVFAVITLLSIRYFKNTDFS